MNPPDSQPQSNFVKCRCEHCDGKIEFDATGFDDGEARTVKCPHCNRNTAIFLPQTPPPIPPIIAPAPLPSAEEFRLRQISEIEADERAKRKESGNRIISDVVGQEKFTLAQMVPSTLQDFIGQERVKTRIEIAIAAAKSRNEALDHVLLIGQPGLGKTTLAYIIARAMAAKLKATSGPTIENGGDLAGLLTNLEEGDVLFIDEIHRLRRNIEEYFYAALAEFKLDVIIDQGPNARSVRLNLPRFTLIGTTTNRERITPHLLSCFPTIERLDAYSVNELAAIVLRFAKALDTGIEPEAAEIIARSADGTPLDALNRLRHIRDYAHVKKSSQAIAASTATEALRLLAPSEQGNETTPGRLAIPSEVRREVWRRDEGRCVKCGSRERLHYDHIIPVSKGGGNTARNIELLCEVCNLAKSDLIQ